MKELLENMNKTYNQLDEVAQKTLGVTMDEVMNEKDPKKLDEYLDTLAESIINKKNEIVQEAENKKKRMLAKTQEVEDGQHFKVYEAENQETGTTGVIVDMYGNFKTMLQFGCKGLGQPINQNKSSIISIDDLFEEIITAIKEEIK